MTDGGVETIVETVVIAEILREQGPIETVVERQLQTELVTERIGPQGRPGPKGAPGESFDHAQPAASALWTIAHNLGFRPSVTALTIGGAPMEGEILHLSADVLTISFLLPVAGTAHLV